MVLFSIVTMRLGASLAYKQLNQHTRNIEALFSLCLIRVQKDTSSYLLSVLEITCIAMIHL